MVARRFATPTLMGCVLAAVLADAHAIVTIGDAIEVEGYVNLQNIVRTPRFEAAELIMQRNTMQIEGKYHFLRESTAFGRFATGRLEEATFSLVGRGVYDTAYHLRDAFSDAYDNDDAPAEELKVREAFVDLLLPPVSLRVGRQQIVWGETDNFRALDVINPLDLSWHWTYESWEDLRIPLWSVRAVYDIGKFGPFDESFVEAVWVPWDVRHNDVATDPRRPWALHGAGLREVANSVFVGNQLLDLDLKINDGSPARDLDNGQGGMRFKAIWHNVEFSVNYYYGFATDTGARFLNDRLRVTPTTLFAEVETVNPRTHLVGLTANYSEERFTQAVFRLETVYSSGIPVGVAPGAPFEVDPDQDRFDDARRTVVMLAADRPTWIRALNKQRTFFLSSQVFWRRRLDYSEFYRGIPAVRRASVGGVELPGRFISVNDDKLDQDEFVITFAASTSYGAAGLLQPRFVFAFDPRSTGAYNQIAVDYFLTDHVLLRLQENLYWRASGSKPGPWALGDIWGHSSGNSRHETVFSLIYQF